MAKNSSVNLDITNNADGYDISGGTTPRKLTVTGGSITLTGSGSAVLTFPTATDTLVARTSTDTLTNKSLTSARVITDLSDTNGNELLKVTATGSAVNELTLANAATAANPQLSATGGDTNIGIDFLPKGTGVFNFKATASGPAELRLFEDSDNGTNYAGIIAPASMSGNRTITLPDATTTLVGTDTTQTLTNKTLTAPVISTITNTGTVTLFTASDTVVGRATTDTLTNKRVTPRVGSTTSSGTPTINTDNVDAYSITALAAAITSMTTNLSGTPTDFQKLIIRIKDNGTARAITWGASFEAKGVALPTTTTVSKVLTTGFIYDTVTSKWGCVASVVEA